MIEDEKGQPFQFVCLTETRLKRKSSMDQWILFIFFNSIAEMLLSVGNFEMHTSSEFFRFFLFDEGAVP